MSMATPKLTLPAPAAPEWATAALAVVAIPPVTLEATALAASSASAVASQLIVVLQPVAEQSSSRPPTKVDNGDVGTKPTAPYAGVATTKTKPLKR
eukprot:155960-Prymnesium_polylepis.2